MKTRIAFFTENDDGDITHIQGSNNSARALAFSETNSIMPWKIGFFGDSRATSFAVAQVECQGSGSSALFTQYRTPTWVIAHMKDARYLQSYGVSGDLASGWNAAARTSSKTIAVLNASNLDAVFVQYGINDIVAGASAATVVLSLKRLCLEIMKGGKYCIFEAINPLTTAYTGYATYQPIVDAANALMQTWFENFPQNGLYVDTATTLKNSGSYGAATYYNADGIHFSRLGAYTAGKILANACRKLMPARSGVYFGNDATAPNLISQYHGFPLTAQFETNINGTATYAQSNGEDENGVYYGWTVTPTALASGYFQGRLELSVNFQTASPPAYAVAIGEIVESTAILVVDDGSGGASTCHHVTLRQRFYTGSNFSDWGSLVSAAPSSLDSVLTEALNIRAHTPRTQITAASVVANPSAGAGFQLQAIVETATITTPIRVRMYNPQIRRFGYSTTPVSVTPPASTVAYTNSSGGDQQVTISGGTVTVIAVNGVTSGLTAGTFILSKGDTLTPTYSVAPTMLVKQF